MKAQTYLSRPPPGAASFGLFRARKIDAWMNQGRAISTSVKILDSREAL